MVAVDVNAARFEIVEAVAGYTADCLWLSWDTAGARYVDIDGTPWPRRGRAQVRVAGGGRVRLTACAQDGTPGDVRYAYLVREFPAAFPRTDVLAALAGCRPATAAPGLAARAQNVLGLRLRQLRWQPGSPQVPPAARLAPRWPRLATRPTAGVGRKQQTERGGDRTWEVY
jgi:hypothetical protein